MPFGLPDTVLTTELDAINYVMKAKGLDLVAEIDLGDADTADAAFHLNVADLGFQSKGWGFNKDYSLTLPLDGDSKIPVPLGTVSLAASYYSAWSRPFAMRQGYLWDLVNKTFVWASPQVVDIVVRVAYEDMWQQARNYVALLGAHNAQALSRGDTTTIQITSQMLLRALTEVEWEQDKVSPSNQVHGNISVQAAVNGWGGMRRGTTT